MLAPIPMIGAAVALILMLDIAALQLLGKLPHPDQQLSVVDGEVVFADTGERVDRLESLNHTIAIVPTDLMEEPDILPDRATFDAFFVRQQKILDLLNDTEPVLVMEDRRLPLTFHAEPLPGTLGFWIQLLVANLGFLVGVAVWTFQRSNPAALHFCVTGIGLACAAMAAGIYSSRPLALDGDVFELLSILNYLGATIFSCGFMAMMWNFPKPLFRVAVAPYWYLAALTVPMLEFTGVVSSLDVARRSVPIFALLGAFAFLAVQWRQSRNDPLTRQLLKWFFLVTISGSTFFIAMVFIPPLLNVESVVSQAAAFLAFLTIYVGLALGVSRYPVFDLQQYWMKTLIWLAGGFAVIAVNLLIVRTFGLSNVTAFVMMLVSFALVYVPLRSIDARYVFNRASKNFQEHLPLIVARMARYRGADLADVWEQEIIEIFKPLESEKESIQVVKPVVVKGGLGLVVPAIQGGASYHLSYADQGTRLFSSLDVTLIETLTGLFEMTASSGKAAENAAEAERGRLRRDLHDTLGGRLLTIMHSSEDGRMAQESRTAMGELREILTGIDNSDSLLQEAFSKWEVQLRDQCEALGVVLKFTTTNPSNLNFALPGHDRFNLGQILREAVTNAIRHAQATNVSIQVDLEIDELRIMVANNGDVIDPAEWSQGYGTRNIRERASELDAEISWQLADGFVRMQLWLMLERWGVRPQSADA